MVTDFKMRCNTRYSYGCYIMKIIYTDINNLTLNFIPKN